MGNSRFRSKISRFEMNFVNLKVNEGTCEAFYKFIYYLVIIFEVVSG